MTPLLKEQVAPSAETTGTAGAGSDPVMAEAVERLLAVGAAADEALARLHSTDAGGWGGFDDDAERLMGEAEDAAEIVADGWAAGLVTPEDGLVSVREYVGRRRRIVRPAVVQSGPVDWGKSRGAA